MISERRTDVEGTPPPLIQWGGVFAGTVIGLAAGGLLSLLWLGLAYGSHRHLFYQHLDQWLGATAIFAMLLAGVVAGAPSAAFEVSLAGIANGGTGVGTGGSRRGRLRHPGLDLDKQRHRCSRRCPDSYR